MALLLHIDTAQEKARISLAEKDQILAEQIHIEQKTHASFLQPAIEDILKKSNKRLEDLDGVSVSGGPGSYTGLRVGLASAKGLCYTLSKPLILLNTLEIMTTEAIMATVAPEQYLYAPLIDARRMEVFGAVYNTNLVASLAPGAYLLDDPNFLAAISGTSKKVLFFGSGMEKWKNLNPAGPYEFISLPHGPQAQNNLAQAYFSKKQFADIAYSEPLYFKSFYTTAKIL